jgi:glycosyltransferase involved in cell wall biosynthesis
MFLARTIQDILEHTGEESEVIAVLDGYLPNPQIVINDDRVIFIHNKESIGQRQAINQAARIAKGKYIMKLDAHCILDEGFDVKLMNDMQPDWTVVPRMYNAHIFDWKCIKCGKRTYMGPVPTSCSDCDNTTNFKKRLVWQPRWNRRSDFMRFDDSLHFQYWKDYEKRPEAQGDVTDLMSCLGACWMFDRERYFELGGLDEKHGSWGQMGTEISCMNWLSGGKLCVSKKTWFSHFSEFFFHLLSKYALPIP